jgi:S1-C subfamily serine protease
MVITEINGKPLVGDSAFAATINGHKVGVTITLTVLRGNDRQSIKVTLAKAP